MHLFNAMFGRGLGGIEQAFLDYTKALLHQNNHVTCLIHPDAQIYPALTEFIDESHIVTIPNLGLWDPIAVWRLRKTIQKHKAEAIITHGNRAAALMQKAANQKVPVVGLAHNYNLKRLIGLDAIFCITTDIRNKVIELGQAEQKTYHIPNMIMLPADLPNPRPFNAPPVIGSMGRFVQKKGYAIMIEALANCRDNGYEFQTIIGGDGEERTQLLELVEKHNLQGIVQFPGWIENKQAFFESIDIFCLPSLHEPFGIVLLEAFTNACPIVTTNSEGPQEIITPGYDAIMVERHDTMELATGLQRLLDDPAKARDLAINGLETVKEYGIENISNKIQVTLKQIVGKPRE